MTTHMADRTLDRPLPLHLDAAEPVTIRSGAAVTPDSSPSRPDRNSPEGGVPVMSVDAMYSTLIDELGRVHFDRVAVTVSRRRSLTDSLHMALDAHWDAVVEHRHEHRAVRSIDARRRAGVAARTPTDGRDGRPAREVDDARPDTTGNAVPWSPTGGIATWLDLIGDAHHIRWELPRDQLSLLVAATLEGLTVGYLATGDPEPARAVLRVLAYQVARYGRRPAKNQQH